MAGPSLCRQLVSLGLGLGLGLALGLLYVLLRPLRRRPGRAGAAADVLFTAAAALCVFLFAMGAGDGRLGLWQIACIFAGFSLILQAFRPFARRRVGDLHKNIPPEEGKVKNINKN